MRPEQVKKRVERILAMKEWLDDRVSQVFHDYCGVFDIHPAYGVESFTVGNVNLQIVQDISCRGCYDTTRRTLLVEYLYLEQPDRLALMKHHKVEQAAVILARDTAAKRSELAQAAATVERLSRELSS